MQCGGSRDEEFWTISGFKCVVWYDFVFFIRAKMNETWMQWGKKIKIQKYKGVKINQNPLNNQNRGRLRLCLRYHKYRNQRGKRKRPRFINQTKLISHAISYYNNNTFARATKTTSSCGKPKSHQLFGGLSMYKQISPWELRPI